MVTVPPAADLQRLTGYWLRRAFVRASDAAQLFVGDDVRPRELGALFALAEQGEISQRRLGELCQISPTLTVRLVDELERKGFATRERSTTDRRVQTIRLNEAGRQVLRERVKVLDAADRDLVAGLTATERRRLRELLRALLRDSPVLQTRALVDRTGYLVAHAHRQFREDAARRLGELDLHPRDFGLLNLLAEEEPCSQARLAECLDISPPAVLALLDALEAQDLVGRERDPADRRKHQVRLTAHGRDTLQRGRRLAAGIQRETVQRLGAEGDAELRRLLEKLCA